MRSNPDFWVEAMTQRHGWYIHHDLKDTNFPYSVNIHTHGLNKFGHLDIQVCYPLTQQESYILLLTIAEKIKSGMKFSPCIKYPDIIEGYEVEFAEAEEDGRIVLRVIFPDKSGNVRGELKDQLKGCRVYAVNN